MYNEEEFPNNFSPAWSVNYNRHGDGCAVAFPVRLHPHLKFVYRKTGDGIEACSRDFTEIVNVSVIKE